MSRYADLKQNHYSNPETIAQLDLEEYFSIFSKYGNLERNISDFTNVLEAHEAYQNTLYDTALESYYNTSLTKLRFSTGLSVSLSGYSEESFMESIKAFFKKIGTSIANFFKSIWNWALKLLGMDGGGEGGSGDDSDEKKADTPEKVIESGEEELFAYLTDENFTDISVKLALTQREIDVLKNPNSGEKLKPIFTRLVMIATELKKYLTALQTATNTVNHQVISNSGKDVIYTEFSKAASDDWVKKAGLTLEKASSPDNTFFHSEKDTPEKGGTLTYTFERVSTNLVKKGGSGAPTPTDAASAILYYKTLKIKSTDHSPTGSKEDGTPKEPLKKDDLKGIGAKYKHLSAAMSGSKDLVEKLVKECEAVNKSISSSIDLLPVLASPPAHIKTFTDIAKGAGGVLSELGKEIGTLLKEDAYHTNVLGKVVLKSKAQMDTLKAEKEAAGEVDEEAKKKAKEEAEKEAAGEVDEEAKKKAKEEAEEEAKKKVAATAAAAT
jgi:hypothetical protein